MIPLPSGTRPPAGRRGADRLRRFAAASALVTSVDVAVLVAVAGTGGLPVAAADAVAVALASAVSWSAHRAVAGAGDPFERWVDRPAAFLATAGVAGALDVAVVSALTSTGSLRRRPLAGLLGAKALALALAGGLRVMAYRAVLLGQTRRGLELRRSRPEPPGELRLSVVVPAYREQDRIAEVVKRITEVVAPVTSDGGAEVVVVDDGSPDATAAEAAAAGARVVSLGRNRGKGAAVREGVLSARGRTVAFIDADLAYPPEQVLDLLAAVESGWDVVVGSRHHPASLDVSGTSALRSLSGRLFNLLTALVLLGHYRDTQCGCKAFRSDAGRAIFSHTKLDGFAFDVEVFHLVERYHLSLTEVPVTLVAAAGSTVRVGVDALAMVRDLFRLRRWSGQGAYDLVPAEVPGPPG